MANDVTITIKGHDQSSQAINNVIKNLEKLGIKASVAKTNAQKLDEGWSSFMTGLNQSIQIIERVGRAVQKAYDFAKAGAEIELVKNKFNNLTESIGTTSQALMKDLRNATSGMLSDSELMSSALDFMALGLAKNHDEAVRLANVAGQLNMNMNQLVLTLTNMTTMRFDAIGVSVDGFKEKVKALEEAGMSANKAFSEAFLRQAEEQIRKVGSAANSQVGDIKRLEAAFGNFTDTLKEAAAQNSLFDETIQMLTLHLKEANLNTTFDNLAISLEKAGIETIDFYMAWEANKDKMVGWIENAQKAKRILDEMAEALEDATGFVDIEVDENSLTQLIKLKVQLGLLPKYYTDAGYAADDYGQKINLYNQLTYEGIIAEQLHAQTLALTAAGFEPVTNMAHEFVGVQEEIRQKQEDLRTLLGMQDSGGYFNGVYLNAKEVKEMIGEVKGEIDGLGGSMEQAAAKMIWGMTMSSVDLTTMTSDQIAALMQFGIDIGIFTEDSLAAVASNVSGLMDGVETDIGEANAAFLALIGAIDNWQPEDKTFTVTMLLEQGGGISSDLAWVNIGGGYEKNMITGEVRRRYKYIPEDEWGEEGEPSHETDAKGGAVYSRAGGGAYWVGEAGPELFIPSQSGRILSNSQSMSAVGSAMDPYMREQQKQTDVLQEILAETGRGNDEMETVFREVGGPAGPFAPAGRVSKEQLDRAMQLWGTGQGFGRQYDPNNPETYMWKTYKQWAGVPGWEDIVNACKAIETWIPYFGMNITGPGFVSQTPANPMSVWNAPSWVMETVAWNEWMEMEWRSLKEQWAMGYASFGITKEYVKRMWLEQQLLNAHYRIALEEAFEAGRYISFGQWLRENMGRLREEARPESLKNRYNYKHYYDPVTGLPLSPDQWPKEPIVKPEEDIHNLTKAQMEAYINYQESHAWSEYAPDAVGMASGGQTGSGLVGYGEDLTTGTVIGEAGPEVFVAAKAGRVMSNSDLMKAFGGAGAGGLGFANFNINITSAINMADRAWVERELMPYIRKGIREYLR